MEDRDDVNYLHPLHCHRCGALFGRCNEKMIVLGGARIFHQTTLYCMEQTCGARFVWRPVRVCGRGDLEEMSHAP